MGETFDLFAGAQEGPETLLPEGGSAVLTRGFLSPGEALMLFDSLLGELDWKEMELNLYGRVVKQPRLIAWLGLESYAYSGKELLPDPVPEVLLDLWGRLEDHCGVIFNSVLANLYRNERDSVAWHSDDEPELGVSPVIASLSLGETRRFQFRSKASSAKVSRELAAGDLVVMSGETQQHWEHCVPKESRALGPRINLTFRTIV